MRSSLKIATVFGIEVRIHVTFLLFLAWIWISYYQVGGLSGAIQGVLLILALFTCVLLHEFGHAFAAREFGIKTPDITLLPIGGVARLSRIPEKPWQELVVAIAGPLVNVVIAAALYFVVQGTTEFLQIDRLENPRIQVLDMLYSINVMLVVFNMIPAFPMDGGRVLRALLAMAMPYSRATQIAAWIGQGLAVLFAFIGVLSYQGITFFGIRGSPFLIFIAFFIFVAAQQEVVMSKARRSSQRE
jgi:Zn-dependent protease